MSHSIVQINAHFISSQPSYYRHEAASFDAFLWPSEPPAQLTLCFQLKGKPFLPPYCWWRGHGYEAGPGGPVKHCLGSEVLHWRRFSPCLLLSFECLQHQSSLLFHNSKIMLRQWNKRLCSELPSKVIMGWVGGREARTSFPRKETLGSYLKTTPPIQKWVSLTMAKISK